MHDKFYKDYFNCTYAKFGEARKFLSEDSAVLDSAKLTCDSVRSKFENIRHVGYYDSFGKVLYDSSRQQLEPLKGEGIEEMHILNGTAASTVVLWKRSDHLLGHLDAFIMIRSKIVDLIIPQDHTGSYFLIVFDSDTPISRVEEARQSVIESMSSKR